MKPGFILILYFSLYGCIDYIKIEEDNINNESDSMPPIIDINHISPHPLRLVDSISVGENCKGQAFKVPPIDDQNSNDRLHYLWFLDNELVWPQSVIEPENRASAIISLEIDGQFLLSHFRNKIPKNFFGRPHVLEFLVSDVQYTIPESRYIEGSNNNPKKHADCAYWIVTFSNDSC